MTTLTRTKTDLITRALQLSEGVSKHLENMTQVVFTGGPFTPAQITSKLQSIVTLRADVNAAKATTTGRHGLVKRLCSPSRFRGGIHSLVAPRLIGPDPARQVMNR